MRQMVDLGAISEQYSAKKAHCRKVHEIELAQHADRIALKSASDEEKPAIRKRIMARRVGRNGLRAWQKNLNRNRVI